MTSQEEEEMQRSDIAFDLPALQNALDSANEFGEDEKDALKSEIFRQRKYVAENKSQILKEEYEKQKDILRGMKERKASKLEIKTQQTSVKSAYDKWYKYTVDTGAIVPDGLYELLEIDDCSKVQRKWLLFYCYNGGNPIDACSNANVSIRMYRKWLKGDKPRDIAFKGGKEDIDLSYADIAEMNLKEMANSKNSAAIIFYLRNRHEEYKDAKKQIEDNKKKQYKKVTDFSEVDKELKKADFASRVGIKTDND